MKQPKLHRGLSFSETLKKEKVDITHVLEEANSNNYGYRHNEKTIERGFWKRKKAFEKLLNNNKIIAKFRRSDGSLKLVFKSGAVFICRGVLVNICDEVLNQ